MDAFSGRSAWHVSMSMTELDGHMKPRQQRAAVDLGRRVLGPAGDVAGERYDWGEHSGVYVVHVRRPVAERELALLPPAFLACPAIDRAGLRPLVLR